MYVYACLHAPVPTFQRPALSRTRLPSTTARLPLHAPAAHPALVPRIRSDSLVPSPIACPCPLVSHRTHSPLIVCPCPLVSHRAHPPLIACLCPLVSHRTHPQPCAQHTYLPSHVVARFYNKVTHTLGELE